MTTSPSLPTWHRRLRAKRARARKFIAAARGKIIPEFSFKAARLRQAVSLLENHHNRPHYSFALRMAWKKQGRADGKGWYGQPKWDAWSPQNSYPKKKAVDKDKQKAKEGVAMAYDAGPWPSSTSSSSATTTSGGEMQAKAFMEAFLEYAKEKDQEVPPALQSFLQPDVKDHLRSQQKRLNKHRNLLQKIDAKKRAIQRDQDQWQKWAMEMKEHIAIQKQRHLEQEDKLRKELQALEKEEEALRNQKDTEENEIQSIPDEDEQDLEGMLEDIVMEGTVKKEQSMEKALEKKQKELEEQYRKRFDEACLQFEQQYQEQLFQFIGKPAEAAPPGLGDPGQPDPVAVAEKTGPAVGPFQRSQKEKLQSSPYQRPKTTEEPKTDVQTMQARLIASHGQKDGQG